MAYLEAYLRAIGAVNGHEQDVEFWGRDWTPYIATLGGGDLLQTFLSKYFCCVYDGEKLLGSRVETGVDTEVGKDSRGPPLGRQHCAVNEDQSYGADSIQLSGRVEGE